MGFQGGFKVFQRVPRIFHGISSRFHEHFKGFLGLRGMLEFQEVPRKPQGFVSYLQGVLWGFRSGSV